jgi:hypothetical protein
VVVVLTVLVAVAIFAVVVVTVAAVLVLAPARCPDCAVGAAVAAFGERPMK